MRERNVELPSSGEAGMILSEQRSIRTANHDDINLPDEKYHGRDDVVNYCAVRFPQMRSVRGVLVLAATTIYIFLDSVDDPL